MDYQEDREASAGVLRLAFQHMTRHPAALTPICYTVWYEHLAGINPRLSERMDKFLADGNQLGDEEIQWLFREFCSEFSAEMQQKLRGETQRILDNIRQYAEDARQSTDDFGGQLEQSAHALSAQQDDAVFQKVVTQLQGETSAMVAAMRGLSENLSKSQDEVDELRQQLERARAEALVDPLTGITNRRGFNLRMDEALAAARQDGTAVALILADIDYFKKVNDTYGHLFGDKVIKGLATVLKAHAGEGHAVARLGGEEFGLLLPGVDLASAQAVSEKIRRIMELSKVKRGDGEAAVGGITVSLGVTMLAGNETASAFFDRADQALYASKGDGRNRVTVV